MKKERIAYLVDSFVDANGDERHFVVAAVSEVFTDDDEPSYVADLYGNEICEVVKGLKIGSLSAILPILSTRKWVLPLQ